jgi:hypothetical protein
LKTTILSLAEFVSLRRQLGAQQLLTLVGRVETAYRQALDVDLTDDAIVVATLQLDKRSEQEKQPDKPTEQEKARLRVIRACIAVREDYARLQRHNELALDRLAVALAGADPHRIRGIDTALGRTRGSKRGARARETQADINNADLFKAAQDLRATRPNWSLKRISEYLFTRPQFAHLPPDSIRKRIERYDQRSKKK